MTQLDKIISQRRSVRSYQKKLPSAKQINQIIKAATQAPSSCNFQLWEFIYVTNSHKLKKLAKVATGKINWAPSCIVFSYDPRLTWERSANLTSLGAAYQNLALKAVDLGLATCPMAGFTGDKKIKQILNIPKHHKIPLIVLVGFPKKNPPKTYRSKIDQVLHFNNFSTKRPVLDRSIHLKNWTQSSVLEYRRRIFSTYLFRFKLNFFQPDNSTKIWNKICQHISMRGNCLYLYPWDHQFIPILKKTFKQVYISGHNHQLLDYYSKSFKVNQVNLTKDSKTKTQFDTALIINKLEFEKQPAKLFKFAHKRLNNHGQLILTTFNTKSLYVTLLRLGIFLKYFPDVYHNSPFYKWGPINFYSDSRISELLIQAGFKNITQKHLKLTLTDDLQDKLRNKPRLLTLTKFLLNFVCIFVSDKEVTLTTAKKA